MDAFQYREARAQRRIDRAALGAGAWVVTLGVLGIFSMASWRPWDPDAMLAWGALVPAILLAFGIARRSRTAAVLLLGYVVLWEGSTALRTGSGLAALFLVLFGRAALSGVLGTWEWHRVQHERAGAG